MAEAIAAFGLAANVVQFLSFGSNVVSSLWKMHRKGEEGAGILFDLVGCTANLERILTSLSPSAASTSALKSECERNLDELATQCQSLASEILQDLRQLRSADNPRKRDALRIAVRLVLKEDDLQAKQRKLESVKQDLILCLLAALREQSGKSLSQQELVMEQLAAIQSETRSIGKQAFEKGLGVKLMKFLTAKVDEDESKSWKGGVIKAIYDYDRHQAEEAVTEFAISPQRRMDLQSAFLARLHYSGMNDREKRIAEAYEKTFNWIFDREASHEKPWSNFVDWLGSDGRLYWITGKAGSGKSTLLKFVCQSESQVPANRHKDSETSLQSDKDNNISTQTRNIEAGTERRCEKYLKKWAQGSTLILATYFFWNSGVQLQMSKKGLLISLLAQILSRSPDLIQSVAPNRWEALCFFNEDLREWSQEELEEILRLTAEKLHKRAKICFFIDGLDEFEGPHDDLVHLFQDLIANPNIKVCVSSRPWILFEDAFKYRPSLTLQDLTEPDIRLFVTSRLYNDTGFARLRRMEAPYAEQLAENIVSKASGVFLWVHLVVASLLAGMSKGDRTSDLQRRLDLLPPDLEDLYEKILQSLEVFYLEHAAQLFKIIQESLSPPTTVLLSYIDDGSLDSTLKQPMRAVPDEDMALRIDTMRRRLNSRCKGLLEVRRNADSLAETKTDTVEYLHRTVKDYVEQASVRERFEVAIKSDFDTHLQLLQGNISNLKTMDDSLGSWEDGSFWVGVQSCLYSASRVKPQNRSIVIRLLDELDWIGKVSAKRVYTARENLTLMDTGYSKFTNKILEESQWSSKNKLLENGQWVCAYEFFQDFNKSDFGFTFLSLAVRYGIVDYVQAKVHPRCLVQHPFGLGAWPLLMDATQWSQIQQRVSKDNVPDPKMVACLLANGANPNYVINSPPSQMKMPNTVWGRLFDQLVESSVGMTKNRPWDEIAGLMVNHGADLSEAILHPWMHSEWNNSSALPASIRNQLVWVSDIRLSPALGVRGTKALTLYKFLLTLKKPESQGWNLWFR